MNENITFPATSAFDKRFARLLELLQGVNEQIETSIKWKDDLGVRQYEHLKKQYVNQLIELFEEMNVSLKMEEAA